MLFFLLDFYHWLHTSDTLTMATRSKPDVAFVWLMQCAWMTSRHGKNDRVCRLVERRLVLTITNYRKPVIIHKSIHLWSPGDARSREKLSFSAFGACAIETKMQAVQVGTTEQSFRRARGQARVWILLISLHHRIRAIVQTEDSHVPYQRNYCYIVSLVIYPRMNLFFIYLFGNILKQVININMLLLPIICTYCKWNLIVFIYLKKKW